MQDGYHGETFGAMAVGDSRGFHGRFDPWLFESRVFSSPVCEEANGRVAKADADASLSDLEALLEDEGNQVAAVILEPSIQGPAGMRLQPKGFLKAVEQLCRRFDIHLILDEVFVGCGRTGTMLACDSEAVEPDFLCLAKGLTAGYLPLAATLATESVYEAFLGSFDSGKGFFHGHTFTGNPLAACVALKSIEKLERLIDSGRLEAAIAYFGERFESTFRGDPYIGGMRQRGLAAAIDLRPGSGQEAWLIDDRVGMQVCMEARKHGLLLRPLLDSILIVPPLVISPEETDFLFENLKTALAAVMKKISH